MSKRNWVNPLAILLVSFGPAYLFSGQAYQPDAVVSVVANVELLSLVKEGQYVLMMDAPGGYCLALQPGETPLRIHSVSPELIAIDSYKKTTSWNESLEGSTQTAHLERIIIPTRAVVKVTMPAPMIAQLQPGKS